MLSSSRMIKDARGDVDKAAKMAQEMTENMLALDTVEQAKATDAGILELVPSKEWHRQLNIKLSNEGQLRELMTNQVEQDTEHMGLAFTVSYARSRLSKIAVGISDPDTDLVISEILALVGAENKLLSRRGAFAYRISRHVADLYWHDKSVDTIQMQALFNILGVLEDLYQ